MGEAGNVATSVIAQKITVFWQELEALKHELSKEPLDASRLSEVEADVERLESEILEVVPANFEELRQKFKFIRRRVSDTLEDDEFINCYFDALERDLTGVAQTR